MSINFWFLVLMVITGCGLGSVMVAEEISVNEWSDNFSLNVTLPYKDVESYEDWSSRSSARFTNILYEFIDFLFYLMIEVFKVGVEFGYENPEYDYISFGKALVYLLIFNLFCSLFLPVILLLYVVGGFIVGKVKKMKNKGGEE